MQFCRAGACPCRVFSALYFHKARKGSALRGGFLFHVEKKPKDARGRAQSAGSAKPLLPPCRPPPRTPITGDAVLAGFCRTSGAQNLSGWSEFPPGHWALGLQKLGVMRFHSRAWLCRTNVSDTDYAVGAGVLIRPSRNRVSSLGGPASVRPLRKEGTALVFARPGDFRHPVGAALAAARDRGLGPCCRGGTPGRPLPIEVGDFLHKKNAPSKRTARSHLLFEREITPRPRRAPRQRGPPPAERGWTGRPSCSPYPRR